MPITCKKNTTQRAWFSIGATLQRAPFFASFSPSPVPLFFFFFFISPPHRAAPETPAVDGETFFHGRGCAPTCGMRHSSSVESFLMTDKTTDRTWTLPAEEDARLCIFRISFFFALMVKPAYMMFIRKTCVVEFSRSYTWQSPVQLVKH